MHSVADPEAEQHGTGTQRNRKEAQAQTERGELQDKDGSKQQRQHTGQVKSY